MRLDLAACARRAVHPISVTTLTACLILGPSLAPRAEAAPVIARSEVHLKMPRDTKPKEIKGLFLGIHRMGSVAEITSIRLKSLPKEGVEKIPLVWVVTMNNTRRITQALTLKISFYDERGKRLASGRGRLSIASGSVDKEFEIKMKVKASAWEASSKLGLQADWIG